MCQIVRFFPSVCDGKAFGVREAHSPLDGKTARRVSPRAVVTLKQLSLRS